MEYHASCHCGDVAIRIESDAPFAEALECNCSFCSRRGHLLAFVPEAKVTMTTPESALSTYTFNTHSIRHHFCARCGIGVFSRGDDPRSGPVFALNLRCVEGLDLSSLAIRHVDGRSR